MVRLRAISLSTTPVGDREGIADEDRADQADAVVAEGDQGPAEALMDQRRGRRHVAQGEGAMGDPPAILGLLGVFLIDMDRIESPVMPAKR